MVSLISSEEKGASREERSRGWYPREAQSKVVSLEEQDPRCRFWNSFLETYENDWLHIGGAFRTSQLARLPQARFGTCKEVVSS